MTACSGPGCNHSSHITQPGSKVISQDSAKNKADLFHYPLTRNQRKAKRRKGVPGY